MAPPLKPSWRKGAGIALILLLILIWAALVASLSPWVGKWPILVQAAFYLVMGIVWIIPLKPLIRWSQSDPSQNSAHSED
jgi:membrane protein implicated in regulation of membrane protease activity